MHTHSLLGPGAVYRPSSAGDPDLTAEATAHVLGGSDGPGVLGDTPAARRARVLEAAKKRLKEQEKEIEDMCGVLVPSLETDGDLAYPTMLYAL